MIVKIRGEEHECRTATMENGKITLYLNEVDEQGNERTSVFIGFSADEITGIEDTQGPTLETRVDSLETESAEMREALEMILAGVTE